MHSGLIDEVSAVLRHAAAEVVSAALSGSCRQARSRRNHQERWLPLRDREAEQIITPRLMSPPARVAGRSGKRRSPIHPP